MANIYIIAGQSNAVATSAQIRAELQARDPGCIVLTVASAGAPLTWGRPGTDWFQAGDMRDLLLSEVVRAMRANPEASLRSMIWVQGEGDTYGFARAESYGAQFLSLLQQTDRALQAALPGRQVDFDVVSVQLSAQAPAARTGELGHHHQRTAQAGCRVGPDRVGQSRCRGARGRHRRRCHVQGFAALLAGHDGPSCQGRRRRGGAVQAGGGGAGPCDRGDGACRHDLRARAGHDPWRERE